MIRTKFAKFCGRGTRDYSTSVSSSFSVSSAFKRRWREQKISGLLVTFLGGYCFHFYLRLHERNEHWHKVDRMYNEETKRSEDLSDKFLRYLNEDYDDVPKPGRKNL
ncbi:unnamed protein product [Eruca vesicaria subsp. sativa]|uniref:Uncharacterized protein n=1 Tax=Eruca vesicaria subsp. sativa TaxID=29727 RepID=A0ABC8LK28_ERUVS|nr:unnamed protein product [Eruca vesicaria subsp. sativa]